MSGTDELLRCKGRKRIGHAREVLDAELSAWWLEGREGHAREVLDAELSAWWLEGREGHAPAPARRA